MRTENFLQESGRARAARLRVCLRRASSDSSSEEAIHDLRVAIRRVLAWIAVREDLMGPDPDLRKVRSSLKGLMAPLGKLRDAHVKRDWIRETVPEGDESSYLYAVLVASEVNRWESGVRKILQEPSTRRLRAKVADGIGRRGIRPESAVHARDLLRRLEHEVLKHRVPALDPANPMALHRMRLAFKRYRYSAELLLPLFSDSVEETKKRLHGFQTLLGTIHDFDVILADAHALRRDFLGVAKESDLETAFRRLREEKLREFREIAGTARRLSRVFRTNP